MMHRKRCREVELVFCRSTRVTDVTEDGFTRLNVATLDTSFSLPLSLMTNQIESAEGVLSK
jgi:hypothetical protein